MKIHTEHQDELILLEWADEGTPRRSVKRRVALISTVLGGLLTIGQIGWWLLAPQVSVKLIRPDAVATNLPLEDRIRQTRRQLDQDVLTLVKELERDLSMPPDDVQQMQRMHVTLSPDEFLQRLPAWLQQLGYRLPAQTHVRIEQNLSRWQQLQQWLAELSDEG